MRKENVVSNKGLSSRQFVGRDLPHPLLLGQEEKQPCFTRDVEDPRQRPSGMTTGLMGFTLIELLVVVLIIGILAAVALPQYKVAVAKSRIASLLPTAKSVLQAEEVYYIANGQYTRNWDEISVDVPGVPDATHSYVMKFSDGDIGLTDEGVSTQSWLVEGLKVYFFYEHTTFAAKGMQICYASQDNTFAQKICQALTYKKTRDSSTGNFNMYYF